MADLYAVSDIHVTHAENADLVQAMQPVDPSDWLIVAGDVAATVSQVQDTLQLLRQRWSRVLWVPGNHELWTTREDANQARGAERYTALVAACRQVDVLTPEDLSPVFASVEGPRVVAGMFLLYDYSFRPRGMTAAQAMAWAHDSGVVCNDEFLLHPDPHSSREAWCRERVALTSNRLDRLVRGLDADTKTVLVNHFPLRAEHTKPLYYQQFAQWCGTVHTEDWHLRYRASDVVYGHLHIPRHSVTDGVRFHEVSIGYPRERQLRGSAPLAPRLILRGAS
ncbi:MAG: metallophosphoesterase [Tetrasphaera sp.]